MPPADVAPDLNVVRNFDSDLNLGMISISLSDVFVRLNKLDLSKESKYDEIPPLFLRICSYALARPLWYIFNVRLERGVFPTYWKPSLVMPVFKSSDRSDIGWYRPIFKISVLPKIFEDIVIDKLTPLVANILCKQQRGFVSRRSTVTNLGVYHCFVSEALEESLQVDTVYTDFNQAFDTVGHGILVSKLSSWIIIITS